MPSMTIYSQGDVVLVPFPFTDLQLLLVKAQFTLQRPAGWIAYFAGLIGLGSEIGPVCGAVFADHAWFDIANDMIGRRKLVACHAYRSGHSSKA
jgi:hypothetical protein